MLQKVDKDRLDKVLSIIKQAQIRFPIAEIEKKMGVNKGNASAYLKGSKPMSDNFYNTFLETFRQPEPVPINQGVTNFAGDIATKMLINDAKMDVLYQQVVQVMSQSTGRPVSLISVELQQAIELTVLGKMEQLGKL